MQEFQTHQEGATRRLPCELPRRPVLPAPLPAVQRLRPSCCAAARMPHRPAECLRIGSKGKEWHCGVRGHVLQQTVLLEHSSWMAVLQHMALTAQRKEFSPERSS